MVSNVPFKWYQLVYRVLYEQTDSCRYGTAAMLEDEDAVREQVVGTPYWMAPEVIEMSGASAASDVWSVACTVVWGVGAKSQVELVFFF